MKVEEQCKKLKDELVHEFSDVFREELLPRDKINGPPVVIEVDEDLEETVVPTNVKAPRDVHIKLRRAADQEIKELLAAGIIAECKGPTKIVPTECLEGRNPKMDPSG